jgi:hypothetical protein
MRPEVSLKKNLLSRTLIWQVKIKKGEKSSNFFLIFLDYNYFFARFLWTGRHKKNFFLNIVYLFQLLE